MSHNCCRRAVQVCRSSERRGAHCTTSQLELRCDSSLMSNCRDWQRRHLLRRQSCGVSKLISTFYHQFVVCHLPSMERTFHTRYQQTRRHRQVLSHPVVPKLSCDLHLKVVSPAGQEPYQHVLERPPISLSCYRPKLVSTFRPLWSKSWHPSPLEATSLRQRQQGFDCLPTQGRATAHALHLQACFGNFSTIQTCLFHHCHLQGPRSFPSKTRTSRPHTRHGN
mmetsp:Transcript_36186/g.87034  ORF Transcript_36186/g.87034 Transcript_36186/m.87034 type:complete len:223 (-) Transcript_36186:2327-2995(-)